MKKALLLLSIIFLLTGCKETINTYDADMICRMNYEAEVDGYTSESESVIYINYDKGKNITKAIYQSIGNLSEYNDYLLNSLDSIVDIYNKLDGINSNKYIVDDKVVMEIEYDYFKIDLAQFREELGDLIDDESILASIDDLPIKLSEFKRHELEGYDCEVK